MFRILLIALYSLFIFEELSSQDYSIEKESIDSILVWMETNSTVDSNDFHSIGLRTLQKAKKLGDKRVLAQIHKEISTWIGYYGLVDNDSMVYHSRQALKYYMELKDSVAMANAHQTLSIDEMNTGDFVAAQEEVFKGLTIFEALGDQAGVANSYRTLANLYYFLEQPEPSIKYANLALEYYESVKDYYKMAIAYLPLILAYQKAGELSKSHEAADRCIEIVEKFVPEEIYVLSRALSYKSDNYIKENKLDEALTHSRRAFEIVKAEVGELRASSFAEPIGIVLMLQGKYSEALTQFIQIIKNGDDQNIDNLYSLYQKTAECYEKIGDYKNALALERRSSAAQLEMNQDKIDNLESEALIKYETELKDLALAAQEVELQQNSRTQLLGLGILFLLGALLLTLFINYRNNKKITRSLEIKNSENEFLLKEIHHRVKNNLQILSSLLSLQSNYIKDEEASDAIREGRNRVESMGMIHQKLYTDAHKTAIDLKEYVSDLCAYLSDSFLLTDQNIMITNEIDVRLVDVETAIPLGLVINELITNSIKYAFQNRSSGLIHVKLWLNDTRQLCLLVRDNGSGASSNDTKEKRSTNFGTDLVNVLIKKLKGSLEINDKEGYVTTIKFNRFRLVPEVNEIFA